MIGFDSKDPLPKYEPAPEGYEDTFADWNKKAKGEYPLQLVTIHYPRRGPHRPRQHPAASRSIPAGIHDEPTGCRTAGY